MNSRFSWLPTEPDSAWVRHLIKHEPGLIHRRLTASIRSILQSLTYVQIWNRSKWSMEEWRNQRVPVSLLQPLVAWGTALLPLTAAEIFAISGRGDLSLRETCKLVAAAWRELAAVPAPEESRRIVQSSGMSWQQWEELPAYPGKPMVRDFAIALRHSPPPLLNGLLLHGSAADGRVCPGFSDLDLHALVGTPNDASGAALEQFLSWMIHSQKALHAFNPFCHHGVMLTLDLDRRFCAESAMPSALLTRGAWIHSPPSDSFEFAYASDTLGTVSAIAGFESFFESRAAKRSVLAGPFDASWWTSNVLILPLLLWQLERDESIYKREGLDRCNELLSEPTVAAVRRVEQARLQIGEWIHDHAISNESQDEWPGAALERARRVQPFVEADRAAAGIDDTLLVAGRQIWEEVSHRALRMIESRVPDAFSSVKERSFFSWPAAVSERPTPVPADAYAAAREEFVSRSRHNPDVTCVYEFGKIGSAGLSDLDFLVVLARDARGAPLELQLAQLPADVAEIMGHDALFVSEDALADLPAVFPIFDFQLLYAASPASNPTLTRTLDLPIDHVAPMLTRLNVFKYPNDLIWLMRQSSPRWKTLLAYLNSFNHVARCLSFLGIPPMESLSRCTQLNVEIRHRFAVDAIATTGDLVQAMELMFDASVEALFALEAWWRQRYPVLDATTEPADVSTYRTALFESLAAPSFTPPTLPSALRAVLRRCALSGAALEEQPPITESLARFYNAFEPYAEHLRRFLSIEIAAGRTPSAYIHRPFDSRLAVVVPPVRLASPTELVDPALEEFLLQLNAFAADHGLRIMTNWSKAWEYPWIWLNGLHTLTAGQLLVDLGTELSPVPWFLATRGIRCVFIETDRQFESHWRQLRAKLNVDVQWHFVESERLPLPDTSADAVSSFSVIEHQPDKRRAIDEVARVLRPDGLFAVSFDICETDMGMTFPEWNGRALTMKEFEQVLWFHPAFNSALVPDWNVADIPAFKQWHLRAAPHHNYVVAAAILHKRER